MISDLIVWSSVGLALLFTAAYAVSPSLRAWIEQPKHQFLAAAQGYDRAARRAPGGKESSTP